MRCATCPAPAGICLGESVPHLCTLARARDDYRRLLIERAGQGPATKVARDALDAVSSCPRRGPVLPVSQQPECGCSELSECRAGRGSAPGRVTLRDCLACVASGVAGSAPVGEG